MVGQARCSDPSTVVDRVFPWYDYRTTDFDRIWLLTATPLLFSTVLTLTGIFYYVYLGTLARKVEDIVLYTNYAFNVSNMTYLMCFILTTLSGKWQFLLLAITAQLFSTYSQILLAYLIYLSMLPLNNEFNTARVLFTCWITFITIASGRVLVILIAHLVAMSEGGGEWDLKEPKSERVLRHEKLAQEALRDRVGNFGCTLTGNCCYSGSGSMGNECLPDRGDCCKDSSGSIANSLSELV
ncbi:hypothetical protein BMR1_02g02040 [Babesia microti strain RI]|uniref:Uncharacterized protein n=1 Tax=Babesia microti (strain RI) TaxID=1133968 RepID=I7IGB4_BABMR|nr:hypothetical protein BMR1_02g02040 [Babesia microti strain RI]CCF73566.1 hypothetical protein BMR1_02g02040 [Babesia microti strain RI]|eukprot:XP_012648175.1 hypothetical protein BMR1_02g02040 [Babesia microti strain RI]